jgi:hypothetical protein
MEQCEPIVVNVLTTSWAHRFHKTCFVFILNFPCMNKMTTWSLLIPSASLYDGLTLLWVFLVRLSADLGWQCTSQRTFARWDVNNKQASKQARLRHHRLLLMVPWCQGPELISNVTNDSPTCLLFGVGACKQFYLHEKQVIFEAILLKKCDLATLRRWR